MVCIRGMRPKKPKKATELRITKFPVALRKQIRRLSAEGDVTMRVWFLDAVIAKIARVEKEREGV